jgi:prepilin-type N-terminal cleavage/methylation domain-containing protein
MWPSMTAKWWKAGADPLRGRAASRRPRGLTLVELVVVVALMGMLVMIGLPFMTGSMQASRLEGAVRQIASDLRAAQARASLTGWQYRVVGYNESSGDAHSNQYRLMGRSSAAIAWPADTVGAFEGATQMAGDWVDVDALYPGVTINPASASPQFWVTFDSRGVAIDIAASCNPMLLSGENGTSKSLRVTTAGSVRIQ